MPVIMMSADDRWENQRRATAVGASGFLLKSMIEEGWYGSINLELNRGARVVQ